MQQIDLFLPDGGPKVPLLGDCEPVPPGPYRVSMLFSNGPGEGTGRYTPPYKIVAGSGQTIAGHIDNLATALRIRDLMNEHGPGQPTTGHEGEIAEPLTRHGPGGAAATGEHP